MVRLAIIGAGRMGATHARVLSAGSAVEVSVIVDLDAEVGSAVAAGIGADFVADLDTLAARPDIDGWLVASSTHTHGAVVSKALDVGTPVLCEKPLTLDLDESVSLADRARREGVPIQVGFWRRFSPPWARLKDSIETGEIGRPIMMRFAQWDADPPPAEFCDPAVSGGLAIDCGVHEFDLAEWFTGRQVIAVSAWSAPIVEPAVAAAGDVDNLVATLELSDGAIATVELSRNVRYGDDVRTEIVGSNGAGMAELLPSSSVRIGLSGSLQEQSTGEDAMEQGLVGQAEAFARIVSGDRPEVPGPLHSMRAVAIGLAVQESIRSGRRVEFVAG